jgi:hypothetical protein
MYMHLHNPQYTLAPISQHPTGTHISIMCNWHPYHHHMQLAPILISISYATSTHSTSYATGTHFNIVCNWHPHRHNWQTSFQSYHSVDFETCEVISRHSMICGNTDHMDKVNAHSHITQRSLHRRYDLRTMIHSYLIKG